MATRFLSLLFCLLLSGFGAEASQSESHPNPPPMSSVPAAWLGTASGHDMLWLSRSGRSWRADVHQVQLLEQDIEVDEDAIQMLPFDAPVAWAGTLVEPWSRHGHHGGHHARNARWHGPPGMRVVFDPECLDSIAAYLAERVADATPRNSRVRLDDLQISLSRHRVEVEVDPDQGMFYVSGWVTFQARDGESRRGARRGFYAFHLTGEMQEPADDPVPEPEPAIRVLLLGDNGSEGQVEAALLDAGYEVTTFARYADWDGVTPDVMDFDVAIYLDGFEYGVGLTPAADAALAAFVADGGGLVRTEWSLWSGLVNPMTDPLMPLTYAGGFRYGTTVATDWTVVLPGHPLAAGLDPSWRDLGDYSLATPLPTATVAVESHDGWPLVTVDSSNGGPVIHINHALTYRGFALDPNVLQLFVNAAAFGAGR